MTDCVLDAQNRKNAEIGGLSGKWGVLPKNWSLVSMSLASIPPSGLPEHGPRSKMFYLGAQTELEAHLWHVSAYFEPYKSIREEIKTIGWPQNRFSACAFFL